MLLISTEIQILAPFLPIQKVNKTSTRLGVEVIGFQKLEDSVAKLNKNG